MWHFIWHRLWFPISRRLCYVCPKLTLSTEDWLWNRVRAERHRKTDRIFAEIKDALENWEPRE